MNVSRKRRGFSKPELLLLGSIAAICALWLWPVAAQSGDRAHENVQSADCQSNLKRIGLGLMQYVQDYDEIFPPVAPGNGKRKNPYGWGDVIQPYTKNSALLQCPSEKHTGIVGGTQPGFTDYWFNRNLGGQWLSRVSNITNTVMLGDGDGGSSVSTSRYALSALPASWLKTPYSPARRHLDTGNYAFADGHVKRLRATQFKDTPPHPYTFGLN